MRHERKLWDWDDIAKATTKVYEGMKRPPSTKTFERCVKQRKCLAHVDHSAAGGAVCSESNCVICNCRVASGCGAVDMVCRECSKKHDLCIICGSRIFQQ